MQSLVYSVSAVGRHHDYKATFTSESAALPLFMLLHHCCYSLSNPCAIQLFQGMKREAFVREEKTVAGREGSLIVLHSWIIQFIWDNWSSVRSSVSTFYWGGSKTVLDSDMAGSSQWCHPVFVSALSVCGSCGSCRSDPCWSLRCATSYCVVQPLR